MQRAGGSRSGLPEMAERKGAEVLFSWPPAAMLGIMREWRDHRAGSAIFHVIVTGKTTLTFWLLNDI